MDFVRNTVDGQPLRGSAAIWLLCHYPDTPEADERIQKATQIHKQWGLPIWLYGSSSARYPESVERLLKKQLVRCGVAPGVVVCSGDTPGSPLSLDTVQEAMNVAADAKRKGVQSLVCISNGLQLLQVKELLRREPLEFFWVSTRLRDWRWWYVMGRLLLIPLAYVGIGRQFLPLVLIRRARAKLAAWPF